MDNDGGLLDRAALVDLVRRIQEFDGEDDELTELVHRFNTVVAQPAGSDLIYYTNEIRSR